MPPQQSAAAPRSIDTVSIIALLATVALALVLFIPSSNIPFGATKTFLLAAGALITLAIYILARLSRGNLIFPPIMLVCALWLPTVAYALSATFSGVTFNNAFWGTALETDTLGFMLIAAAIGTLSALVLRRTEHYSTFLKAGTVVFALVVVIQLVVLIVGQFSPGTLSPSLSIVGSYDDLAFLMGLGVISVLIALRFLDLSDRTRNILILSGVGALAILAVANASLVWILVALCSLGLFVEAVMRRSKGSYDHDLDEIGGVQSVIMPSAPEGGHSFILSLVVLAISLFFLIGGTLGGALASALNVQVISVRPSWQSTVVVVKKTYETMPVFGSGPGTFGIEWLKNRDVSLNSTVFWNIDFTSGIGFIPTSFVTTGILGALAWLAFLMFIIIYGLRMLIQRAPRDTFINFVSILSFVATLYLFTIAIFGLPNTNILALAFLFVGLFISTTRFAEGNQQMGIVFSRSPRLGFVIVFMLTILLLGSVVAAYTLVGHYIATAKITAANSALSAGDLSTADTESQSSISFAPNAAAYQIQAGIASARLSQIIASSTMTATVAQQAFQSTLSMGINAALTATRLAPSNYQNWIILGNLYAQAVPLNVDGAYDSAKAAYEKSLSLNPTNPQILYTLAQLNIANRNNKLAEENLKAAIALKPDYITAIFLLSQLEVQSGNVTGALDSALAAAYFTPNDPNILFQIGILRAATNDLSGAAAALLAAVDVNPQFANARYFLSAIYAKQGKYADALAQMKAIAEMSEANAAAVVSQLAALEAKRNPFPANLLTITPAP